MDQVRCKRTNESKARWIEVQKGHMERDIDNRKVGHKEPTLVDVQCLILRGRCCVIL
jgi:hypothetical protein